MSKPVAILTLSDDLPIYPIERHERLDAHAFLKWHHHRWMSSKTFRLASWEVQGMARALFDFAQTESPIGTLPDDDDELAMLLRVSSQRVRELRKMDMGPLRNWRRCLCGNEIRLMHDVVLEQVRDAMERRDTRALSNDQKALAMRLKRLRDALTAENMSKDVTGDEVLMRRMDEWMTENRPGRRTRETYLAAILHARAAMWFTGPRRV